MNILNLDEIEVVIKKIRAERGKIVLTGGCFDILHIGHLTFLEKAKAEGDILVVLLESDQSIRKNKGKNRPINTQKDRVKILAALKSVDMVIPLPPMDSDKAYDDLVAKIHPDIIATTIGDKSISHKRRQAKKLGIELRIVMKILKDKSTSNLIKLLGYW